MTYASAVLAPEQSAQQVFDSVRTASFANKLYIEVFNMSLMLS